MNRFRNREPYQCLLPLELKILTRGPSHPKTYKIHNGKLLKKIFPSAPSSIKFLKSFKEDPDFSETILEKNNKVILDSKSLKILRIRRTLPHFNSNFRHAILRLRVPNWDFKAHGMLFENYKGVAGASAKCLNKIFKQAKHLKSVIWDPKCEISNLKGLTKAHGLHYLSLTIEGNQLLTYPQLFKRLPYLRKVTLNIKALPGEIVTFSKFFGNLLGLPCLEHVTIKMEDNSYHYKQLLQIAHEKKVPSFHIIRDTSPNAIVYLPSFFRWGNCIDTLYLGPIKVPQEFSSENQRPQKKLSLKSPVCFQSDLMHLSEGSTTIKNLEIVDFFNSQGSPNIAMAKPLFKFLSKTKSLENIAMTFETTFGNYSEIVNRFLDKFSEIESLESLQTLTFSLKSKIYALPRLVSPYSGVMKNLKTLNIKLACKNLELHYCMEALEGLESLEEFNMNYYENKAERKEIDCDIPLECLKNLKRVSLTFNMRFSEASENILIEGVHKLGDLRVLFVSPMVLMGIGSKKAEKFIEDLCGIKSLENAGFVWKHDESLKEVTVGILKDVKSGDMKVTSTIEE